jgi:hypothetical protein
VALDLNAYSKQVTRLGNNPGVEGAPECFCDAHHETGCAGGCRIVALRQSLSAHQVSSCACKWRRALTFGVMENVMQGIARQRLSTQWNFTRCQG